MADGKCQHHWIIEAAFDTSSSAKCKKCGAKTTFYNEIGSFNRTGAVKQPGAASPALDNTASDFYRNGPLIAE